jgi:UDP-3-O-[3-hydroxymyristoyl] glucosamine N-acyltransferase
MSDPEELRSKYRTGCKAERALAARDLEAMFAGRDLRLQGLGVIEGATTVDVLRPNRVIFLERYSDDDAAAANAAEPGSVLFIVPPQFPLASGHARLLSEAPRADYTRLMETLFDYGRYHRQLDRIDASARIADSATLMPGVIVGRHSSIGAGTAVHPNVVIGPNCRIGADCIIKSGSIIGQPGFGVFRGPDGLPRHFPHVGGVVIEDWVEVGALNTVCSGSIHPTVIGEFAKLDDHVHVAHNCIVGRRTMLTAAAELSGSVIIGDDCWVGPNSSVIDGARIGARAFIGIGANVTKSVDADTVVAGNPARPIPKRTQ